MEDECAIDEPARAGRLVLARPGELSAEALAAGVDHGYLVACAVGHLWRRSIRGPPAGAARKTGSCSAASMAIVNQNEAARQFFFRRLRVITKMDVLPRDSGKMVEEMKAETEVEVAHRLLDDLEVPRDDAAGPLNLVGRLALVDRERAQAASFRSLLTPREVSRMLKIDEATIRLWLRNGKLAGVKVGHSWRVEREELAAIKKRTVS